MDRFIEETVLTYIAPELRSLFLKAGQTEGIEEIRLRAARPVMVHTGKGEYMLDSRGNLVKGCTEPLCVRQDSIMKTLELMSENSIYAYQEDIRNGFITLKGGHRVGICGKVVLEGSRIKHIKDISGLNIRVAREIKGCSHKLFGYIIKNNRAVYNTLVISPPKCGKTTMLRDIARLVSSGAEKYGFTGLKVGIVDERSEIAACYKGIPQNDVGIRTDVMDGCPKQEGMTMLLRSMSPDVIVTDEIGNSGDKEAVTCLINAGVNIISSAHGFNVSELKTRVEVLKLIEEKVFERYLVLSCEEGPGTLEEVIDGSSMKVLYRRNGLCC